MRSRMVALALLVSPLVTGCPDRKAAARLAECQAEVQELEEGQRLSRHGREALEAEVASLKEQVAELSQTADALWAEATRQGAAKGYDAAIRSLDAFVARYPDDPRARLAPSKRRGFEQAMQQGGVAARLDAVTIEQIGQEPGAFTGSVFHRRLCCPAPQAAEYALPPGLDEAAWSSGRKQSATCVWRWGTAWSFCAQDSELQVRIPAPLARRMAAEAQGQAQPCCKYQFDADLAFFGEIDDGYPVMYLQDPEFAVEQEPKHN